MSRPSLAAVYRELHGLTAHVGGAQVAQVDEFLLAAHIVVESRVSQPEPVGDVLERRAAVAFLIEAVGRGPQHSVTLLLKARFFAGAR